MDYLALLTTEEKNTICEIISGREFKELFKMSEYEFQKLQNGFRAKTLTEQRALNIAIRNINTPFLTANINARIDRWMKEIEQSIESLEKDGEEHNRAFARTILKSYFSKHVDLYLKLYGIELDKKDYARLYEEIGIARTEEKLCSESKKLCEAAKEECNQLHEQIETMQSNADSMKAAYEQKLLDMQTEKEQTELRLDQTQRRIEEMLEAAETKRMEMTAPKFDDTDLSAMPPTGCTEIYSLCCVRVNYNDRPTLIRYADLDNHGQYCIFRKDRNSSPYFENRDWIFHRDGPEQEDYYGIWAWSADPNDKDSSKDYVISNFNPFLHAIEVIVLKEATDLDDLVRLIKNGIACQPHSRKTMFAFSTSRGQYSGILCFAKILQTVNGVTKFQKSCTEVPVYAFSSDDIIHLDSGISFYRQAFAGCTNQIYPLKSPMEIVRDLALSSISWNKYKSRGLLRGQYNSFRDFLSAFPVENVVPQIETACHCSHDEAKAMLDQFIQTAWKYMDGESLEDQIILSAFYANEMFQEKTRTLLQSDWESENKARLIHAEEKLNSLHAEIKSAVADLDKAVEARNRAEEDAESLARSIAEKEKLAQDVENSVALRIQKAQENAADFIASMAFISEKKPLNREIEHIQQDNNESEYHLYRLNPQWEDLDKLEIHHSWSEVIKTTRIEFESAGVSPDYANGLAAFFCAAYLEKQPLLLVGPNSIEIAHAFAAAVAGHKYGTLCCEGDYSHKAVHKIGEDGEDIVILQNLLASGWMNRLPGILSRKDILYIAVHPYTEDIQVEPKSLYGFMLPLFTDFFVVERATGDYWGGCFADDFDLHTKPSGKLKTKDVLSRVAITALVKNCISKLLATMHGLASDIRPDDELLFALLPIAYATMSTAACWEMIDDMQKNFQISVNLKQNLKNILGERP